MLFYYWRMLFRYYTYYIYWFNQFSVIKLLLNIHYRLCYGKDQIICQLLHELWTILYCNCDNVARALTKNR